MTMIGRQLRTAADRDRQQSAKSGRFLDYPAPVDIPCPCKWCLVLSKRKDTVMRFEICMRRFDFSRPIAAVQRKPNAIDTPRTDRVMSREHLLPYLVEQTRLSIYGA
ncbi:hypothetical protein AL062_21395 [Pseudomonas syringae pv. syringae]|nr:hypothetical protein AL062_21395 [Pseudomonas syringae pv. syringae]